MHAHPPLTPCLLNRSPQSRAAETALDLHLPRVPNYPSAEYLHHLFFASISIRLHVHHSAAHQLLVILHFTDAQYVCLAWELQSYVAAQCPSSPCMCTMQLTVHGNVWSTGRYCGAALLGAAVHACHGVQPVHVRHATTQPGAAQHSMAHHIFASS